MGLIKAAVSAVSGSLASQWKDYIKCDDMDMNTLMVKVSAKDGLISKDSAIQVNPGQIAVVFDSGKILDATAEEGQYTFDQSTTPTFFAGHLEMYLKICGLVSHIMELLQRNKQYSSLMLKK